MDVKRLEKNVTDVGLLYIFNEGYIKNKPLYWRTHVFIRMINNLAEEAQGFKSLALH
jgi:hypothetical protein